MWATGRLADLRGVQRRARLHRLFFRDLLGAFQKNASFLEVKLTGDREPLREGQKGMALFISALSQFYRGFIAALFQLCRGFIPR